MIVYGSLYFILLIYNFVDLYPDSVIYMDIIDLVQENSNYSQDKFLCTTALPVSVTVH